MTPIYRPFKDKYLVSCFGTVRNASTFTLIKPFMHYKGYLRVGLYVNSHRKNYSIHRLVATLWVRKPHRKGYNIPNHLDGDKLNNYRSNFEWTDIAGNTRHAVQMGLIDMGRVRSFRNKK